jgi:hypothetical protein
MSQSIGVIDLDLSTNTGPFQRQLGGIASQAEGLVGGAFGKLGLIIAATFAVSKLVAFSKSCVGLASDLYEVQNVVDVTFGQMANQVNEFSKTAITQLGLSELSAKRFTSTMGAMLKSSGLTGQKMTDMSIGITKLSADMASFYNLKAEDAFYKIRAGIAGEVEPLRQIGVNMTVANMEAYALSQGITTSYQKMSQASQVLLRYNYLLSVTKDAQGDFARTSQSWANQTRILSEQWNIFKTSMGQGFINALTPLLSMVNKIIARLQVAAQYFRAFTQMIFGNAQASGAGAGAAAAAAAANDALGNSAGKAADKVKKAAKEASGALGSFDEINLLGTSASTPEAAPEDAGGAGDLDLGGGADKAPDIDTSVLDKVKVKLDMLRDLARSVGQFLWNAFGPALTEAAAMVLPVLERWKVALIDAGQRFATLGAPLRAWVINDLIPLGQQAIGVIGDVAAGVLDSALMVFDTLLAAAFPILEWFVVNGLPMLTQFASGALTIFQSLFDNSKLIFDRLWKDAVDPALKLVSKIIIDGLNILKGVWDKWGADIVAGIKLALDNTTALFLDLWNKFLGPIVTEMLRQLSMLWDNHLKGLVEAILEFVAKVVKAAIDIYNGFIAPLIRYLIDEFGPAFSTVFQFVGGIIASLIGIVADVAKGVFEALGGIIDFIVGVFTGDWKRAWEGIKSIFKGIWDALSGIVKGVINGFIDALQFFINAAIVAVNKLIDAWNMAKSALGIPGWTQPIAPIHFTKLAKGGLIEQPTLAMVGESGKEAVVPLEDTSFVDTLASAIGTAVMNAMRLSQSGNTQSEIALYLDGTRIARALVPLIDKEKSRRGNMAIQVV